MKKLLALLQEKNKNKQALLIILIIGMILMLAAGSFTSDKNVEKPTTYINSDEYCGMLENKLTKILSEMKGVGRVYVMITLENRNAVDISVKNQSGEAILKRSGGTEEPVVTKELYPGIKGVVIAAQGASDADVTEKIYYAAKAALNVGGSKIAVIEAK